MQDAVRAKIEKGDIAAFFRAVEYVIGRPKATVEGSMADNLVERLLEGRKRLAEARRTT